MCVSYALSLTFEAFLGHFRSKIDSFIFFQPEIQASSHTTYEIMFYNFDLSSVLAIDYFQEVVVSCLKTLGKTFLSLSQISCNSTSGSKTPNIQPLLETLHLYFLVFFFLLMGKTPNLAMFDKSALDMHIMTWCKWTVQLKTHLLWLLPRNSPKETKFYLCNVTKL